MPLICLPLLVDTNEERGLHAGALRWNNPASGLSSRMEPSVSLRARQAASSVKIQIEAGMLLTIDLPDEQRAALIAKARAQGLSAEDYARQVLEHDLAPEWLQKSWESAKQARLSQLAPEEIDAEIAAARKARRDSRFQPGA